MDKQKSRVVAGVLGIFLGGLGIHNFYLGKTSRAIAELVVFLVGLLFTCGVASLVMVIVGIVEGIQILMGKIKVDGHGNPLKG